MIRGLEGGCFCAAVRYRLASRPLIVHCCHCTECQNQTGSAFVINALIETQRIELLGGTPVRFAMEPPGEDAHDIYRCRKCGVAVWSDYGRRKWIRFVRVGTLDEPRKLAPDVHIFTRSRQPWVTLPAGTPAFRVYYDPKKTWPAASLARARAARSETRTSGKREAGPRSR